MASLLHSLGVAKTHSHPEPPQTGQPTLHPPRKDRRFHCHRSLTTTSRPSRLPPPPQPLNRPPTHGRTRSQPLLVPASRMPRLSSSAIDFLSSSTQCVEGSELSLLDECPICLDSYTSERATRITGVPGCTHVIGYSCLKALLGRDATSEKKCPICRAVWIPAVNNMEQVFLTDDSFLGHLFSGTTDVRSHTATQQNLLRTTANENRTANNIIDITNDSDDGAEDEYFSFTREINDIRMRALRTQLSRPQRRELDRTRAAREQTSDTVFLNPSSAPAPRQTPSPPAPPASLTQRSLPPFFLRSNRVNANGEPRVWLHRRTNARHNIPLTDIPQTQTRGSDSTPDPSNSDDDLSVLGSAPARPATTYRSLTVTPASLRTEHRRLNERMCQLDQREEQLRVREQNLSRREQEVLQHDQEVFARESRLARKERKMNEMVIVAERQLDESREMMARHQEEIANL